jgi:hypothetical protein
MNSFTSGDGSAFEDVRRFVAIPTTEQLELIRTTARILMQTASAAGLEWPGEPFDLRFTGKRRALGNQPVAALKIYTSFLQGKVRAGELLLYIGYPNLPALVAHEVAHHYDLHCFSPASYFSSGVCDEFADWRAAVYRTETFRRHLAMFAWLTGDNRVVIVDPETETELEAERRQADDILEGPYEEAFARCFCQWVALLWSGNESQAVQEVLRSFNDEFESEDSVTKSHYWSRTEMESLSPLMHQLFDSLLSGKSAS